MASALVLVSTNTGRIRLYQHWKNKTSAIYSGSVGVTRTSVLAMQITSIHFWLLCTYRLVVQCHLVCVLSGAYNASSVSMATLHSIALFNNHA